MHDTLGDLKDNEPKPRDFYRELRCNGCRLLICFEYVFDGYIKYICPRCGEENNFHFKHRKSAKNLGDKVE